MPSGELTRDRDGSGGLPLPRAGSGYPAWLPVAAAAALALAAAGLVVGLGQALPTGRQATVVLVIAVAAPSLLLFLVQFRAVLLAYLFALPLMLPGPLLAGLNGGELMTLGMLALATLGLWQRPERVAAGAAALAPLLWPVLAFAVVSVASVVVNGVYTAEGLISAVLKVVAFGVIALLVYVYADTRDHALSLLRAVLLGGVAVAFYSIYAYLMGWTFTERYGIHRAYGTFSTWNHLGGFMALVSVPTLAMAVRTRRPALRLLLGVGFMAQIVALLLSLTTGSVVALVGGAALASVFVLRVGWRRIAGGAVLALITFAAVLATNPLLRDKLARLDERVIDRLMTYQVGLSMFRDQFWFGFGTSERVHAILHISNRYTMTSFGQTRTVPHNSLLLMGVEKGVFGLVIFTLMVGASLWLVLRCRRAFAESSYALLYHGLIVGLLAFLLQSMTNNLIVHARLGILYFALVALTVRLAEMTGPGSAESDPDAPARAPPGG